MLYFHQVMPLIAANAKRLPMMLPMRISGFNARAGSQG